MVPGRKGEGAWEALGAAIVLMITLMMLGEPPNVQAASHRDHANVTHTFSPGPSFLFLCPQPWRQQ